MLPTRTLRPLNVGVSLLAMLVLPLAIERAHSRAMAQDAPPAATDKPADAKPADTAESRTVTVTAEGLSKDDAVKQALRRALEQGAGTQIASFSQVKDFALIRDTIYSRASGIVSDYRIVEEKEGAGGTVVVKVEATVRRSTVAAAWGEVQNVLDQIGRPKIMVWIDERIDGQDQPDSVVESRIEELFVKAGFDLVERKAIAAATSREAGDAEKEGNAAKLAKLAKDAGAHIFIRGSANADRAGLEDLYGVKAAFYNCDVQAKVYYTDTSKLLASESVPVTRRGVRSKTEFSPQAARAALVEATFPPERNGAARAAALATKVLDSVMEQWSTQISAGGDVELEIEAMDFKTFVKIKKALQELERVKSVDGDFTKGIGSFRIKAQLSAQALAERLTESPFDAWLEVLDLKVNRIQAKRVGEHD